MYCRKRVYTTARKGAAPRCFMYNDDIYSLCTRKGPCFSNRNDPAKYIMYTGLLVFHLIIARVSKRLQESLLAPCV